jgi:hypothetical protein
MSSQLHATAAFLPEETPYPFPMGYETDWVPEQVWTLWKKEKSLVSAPAWKSPRFLCSSANILVGIPAEFSQLQIKQTLCLIMRHSMKMDVQLHVFSILGLDAAERLA